MAAVLGMTMAVGGLSALSSARPAQQSAQGTEQAPSITRRIGTIKAISGTTITLAPDSGAEVAIAVQPNARILRIAPGEKDLKNATPLTLQDLHVGDTIRVRGPASADPNAIKALEILVITRSTVEAVREQIRQDWQKRGLGGLVSSVDPTTGTVTVSITGFGGTKNIAVHTSKDTVFRRYAPDSVRFEDAKPSSLAEIQPGDQLRARGTRSANGAEMTAEEVVAGTFRNLAGTIHSVDASAGTITVQDLLSKKSVTVRVTGESQLRKLPTEVAQRIAMRLKGAAAAGVPGAGSGSDTAAKAAIPQGPPTGSQGGMAANPMGGGMRPGGAPDINQILGRMPAVTLADLNKGDVVMIVATQGTSSSASTAITLLSGVDPILQAAPSASQALMLTPWNLSAPAGDNGN
jgi:hypothetical protein